MKKRTKIFIAFVLIVAIAVGAYFLLGRKNINAQMYQKVYNYTYNLTDGEINIVNKVDDAIYVMNNEILTNNLDLEEENANFELYLEVKSKYDVVQKQILNYGNFVTNKGNEKYVNAMNKAYSSLVKIYENGYEYLQNTYYAENFVGLSNATKITYIKNFNVKIQNIVKTYNDFMHNAGLTYVSGAKNLTDYNNCYKLRLSYYVTLINNSVNLTEENISYSDIYEIQRFTYLHNVLMTDSVDKYVKNNKIYDDLVNNFKLLNVSEIAQKHLSGEIEAYKTTIEKEETKQYVTNYVDYVIYG